MAEGWIKLHRKLNDWEWKTKPDTFNLFIHILLNANHKAGKWRGVDVPVGSLLTGRKSLSLETGLSERKVRTALTNLKSTNELTIQSTNEYSIITITNWKSYQQSDQPKANERPATDQPSDHKQEDNNKKNVKEDKNIGPPEGVSSEVWSDFKNHRKSKRSPITKTALEGIEREALKAGWTLEAALSECCQRGWTGFKAEWVNKDQKGSKNGKTRSELADEATERALRRLEDEETATLLIGSSVV